MNVSPTQVDIPLWYISKAGRELVQDEEGDDESEPLFEGQRVVIRRIETQEGIEVFLDRSEALHETGAYKSCESLSCMWATLPEMEQKSHLVDANLRGVISGFEERLDEDVSQKEGIMMDCPGAHLCCVAP